MPHLRLIILFYNSFILSLVTPTNLVPLLCPSEEGLNCSCNNAYKPLHLYSHLRSTPKLMSIWNPCWLTGEITTGNVSTVSVPASNLRWICNQAIVFLPLGQDNSFIPSGLLQDFSSLPSTLSFNQLYSQSTNDLFWSKELHISIWSPCFPAHIYKLIHTLTPPSLYSRVFNAIQQRYNNYLIKQLMICFKISRMSQVEILIIPI